MSWLEYSLLALLAIWVIASVIWMRNRRKKGRCIGCGGDCAQCPYHKTEEK